MSFHLNPRNTPREDDTPRTRQRKVRQKRLEYYEQNQANAASPASNPTPVQTAATNPVLLDTDVRTTMMKDSRVKAKPAPKPKPATKQTTPVSQHTMETMFPQVVGTKLSPADSPVRPILTDKSSPRAKSNLKKPDTKKNSPRDSRVSVNSNVAIDALMPEPSNSPRLKLQPEAKKRSPRATSSDFKPTRDSSSNGQKKQEYAIDPDLIDEDLQLKVDTSRRFNRSFDTDYENQWLKEGPVPEVLLPGDSVSPTQLARSSKLCSEGAISQVLQSLESMGSVQEMVRNVRQSIDTQPDQDITASLDYKNLYSILGKEKMDRLLNNLHESEWFSSEDSAPEDTRSPINIWTSLESSATGDTPTKSARQYPATTDEHDMKYQSQNVARNSMEYFSQKQHLTSQDFEDQPQFPDVQRMRGEQDVINGHPVSRQTSQQVLYNSYGRASHTVPELDLDDEGTDVTDGFKTHRPEYEEPAEEIFVYDSSRLQDKSVVDSDTSTNRNYVQTIHCAFSAEQIYAEAEHYADEPPQPVKKSSYVPFHAFEAVSSPHDRLRKEENKTDVRKSSVVPDVNNQLIHKSADEPKKEKQDRTVETKQSMRKSVAASTNHHLDHQRRDSETVSHTIVTSEYETEPWPSSEPGTPFKPKPASKPTFKPELMPILKGEEKPRVSEPTQVDIEDVDEEPNAQKKQRELTDVDLEKKETHIAGVKSLVAKRDHKYQLPLPNQLHHGPVPSSSLASFSNPSLERYFTSIENLAAEHSSASSDAFEPIPEPDIEETPRAEDFMLNGKAVPPTKDLRTPNKSREARKTNSENFLSKSVPVDKKVEKVSRQSQSPRGAIGDRASYSKTEQVSRLRQEVDCAEDVKDEDLYSRVTSLLNADESGPALTERLKKLGIDFNFLKSEAKKQVAEEDVAKKLAQLNDNSELNLNEPKHALLDEVDCEDDSTLTGFDDTEEQSKTCSKCQRKLNTFETCSCEKNHLKNSIPVPSKCGKSPRVKPGTSFQNRMEKSWTKEDRTLGISDSTESNGIIDRPRKPQSSLPSHLKDELSLNLRASTESSSKNEVKKSMEGASISIDYSSNTDSDPRKSLGVELQHQLSLNLQDSVESSVKSYTGAKSKKYTWNTKPKQSNGANHSQNPEPRQQNNYNEAMDNEPPVLDSPPPEIINDEDGLESPAVVDEHYNEFVNRLISDPRLKDRNAGLRKSDVGGISNRPSSQQSRRPGSAPARGRRPKSAGYSRVRDSIEAEAPARKWETSSPAWGADVSKSSSLRKSQTRPSSAKNVSASMRSSHARAVLGHSADGVARGRKELIPTAQSVNFTSASSSNRILSAGQKSAPVNPYAKYMALAKGFTGKLYDHDEADEIHVRKSCTAEDPAVMSPRITRGELSMLLCLPDELLLYILSFLPQADRGRCAQVCSHLRRVTADLSLWRNIVVRDHPQLSDTALIAIGRHQPSSLSLLSCQGPHVTASGLRELFQLCGCGLSALTVSSCGGGQLTGDHVLLHASTRCAGLTHLDVSWTNVDDCGVVAASDNANRLTSLCVNGCQQITDEAIHAVVVKHGESLETLELFGCFNITSQAIETIAIYCKELVTLNLGQCWKLSDTCITRLASSLTKVQNLDLRGCKQLTDGCVHHIVQHCRSLGTLALSNCPALTDTCLAEIATYCPVIRSLDVCGCKNIGNPGIRSLATGCTALEYLDISSTQCDHKSISMLSSYCSQTLVVLKVNYCKKVSSACLLKLVKNAPRLRKLFLYGIPTIRSHHVLEFRGENPSIHVEIDAAKIL